MFGSGDMQSNLYISLSAQLALLNRMESVAQNVANVSTPGYRADRISFQEYLSTRTDVPTSFVNEGPHYISTESGAVERTGNPFDIAVSGDGWLGVSTPQGLVYTRDGRFSLSPQGELVSVQGYPLVDIGGSPIQINAGGPAPSIGKDGSISRNGQTLATIGLFRISPDARLHRGANGSVIPDRPAEPQIDFNAASITQGYVERSNVEPVKEMTHLISIQRDFDAISNAVSEVEDGLLNAIRTLAS